MNTLYRWIDSVWQKIAEVIFVRFDFDLPVEELREVEKHSHLLFAMPQQGVIEWLILSSWCRQQGFGAILVSNRKRMLVLAKPLYFLQMLFRRRSYADIFTSKEIGPRLLFCPPGERKRLSEPVPVEYLLCQLYTTQMEKPETKQFQVVPVIFIWRRHFRSSHRSLTEYLFGLGEHPTFIGKIWYLIRARKDSSVRALQSFPLFSKDATEGGEVLEESEAMRRARLARRKILVRTSQEIRVTLGPRYASRDEVKETLLRDPEIQSLIEEISAGEGRDKKKVMAQTYALLNEIVSNVSYRTIELSFVALAWLFNKVFDGVVVREKDFQTVREIQKSKPVVFVSCHRSHLDYMVIPYILFKSDMVTPHIVAGINLNFWPVGAFLKSGGAFFIRRSFRGDRLYTLCVRKYIEYLIKSRHTIKFFIEGTRSRTGKMLTPAYGILKMVMQAQQNQVCDDIALVPVSICYDEVPEQGTYSKELGGGTKVQESASQLIKSSEIIRRKYGKVYVRCGDALSVKQIYEGAEQSGTDATLMLQKTAFQLCKSINDVTPVTAKSMVSHLFLALNKESLSLNDIVRLTSELRDYAVHTHRPLSVESEEGFKWSVEQVVRRLSKSNVLSLSEKEIPRRYRCDTKKRSLLAFYRNNAIHAFVNPCILNLSFFFNLKDYEPTDSTSHFSASVNKTALFLRNLLKFEFFFSPSSIFLEEIENDRKYFFGHETWDSTLLPTLVSSLFSKCQGANGLNLYTRGLADLLESYRTVFSYVLETSNETVEKKAFVQRLVKASESSVLARPLVLPESVSVQNYTNVLAYLENEQIVGTERSGDKTLILLPGDREKLSSEVRVLEDLLEILSQSPVEFARGRGFSV